MVASMSRRRYIGTGASVSFAVLAGCTPDRSTPAATVFPAANTPDPNAVAVPRKDTVNVLPGASVQLTFPASNPGEWMLHCHNAYHLQSGMATVLSYAT